ncbi:MAG: hypothetical protein H7327_03715 [Herminiimonas sp.]|nr:hypothetical protein [Herminiimonas sp.]
MPQKLNPSSVFRIVDDQNLKSEQRPDWLKLERDKIYTLQDIINLGMMQTTRNMPKRQKNLDLLTEYLRLHPEAAKLSAKGSKIMGSCLSTHLANWSPADLVPLFEKASAPQARPFAALSGLKVGLRKKTDDHAVRFRRCSHISFLEMWLKRRKYRLSDLIKINFPGYDKGSPRFTRSASANAVGYGARKKSLKASQRSAIGKARDDLSSQELYKKPGIKVLIREGVGVKAASIRANAIRFQTMRRVRDGKVERSAVARTVVAGQSPRSSKSIERSLLQGLDSGLGLFQFVTPGAPARGSQGVGLSVVDWLDNRLKSPEADGSGPVVIGGRYEVCRFVLLNQPGAKDHVDMQVCSADHRCFRLAVRDLENPGVEKVVFITEASLGSSNCLLNTRDVVRADDLMEAHNSRNRLQRIKSNLGGEACSDPMVLSCAGVGRNAALICYREAESRFGRIGNAEEIEHLLRQIVEEGRRDQGPYFLSSQRQFDEVKNALIQRFNLIKPAVKQRMWADYAASASDSASASATAAAYAAAAGRLTWADDDAESPRKRARISPQVMAAAPGDKYGQAQGRADAEVDQPRKRARFAS